jgi:bacterioferritin
VEVEKRQTSPDVTTMLQQDLDGEEYAVAPHKGRIRQAWEMQEYGLRRALEDILIVEEEHRRDLVAALGR